MSSYYFVICGIEQLAPLKVPQTVGSSADFATSVDAHAVAAVTKASLWIYYDLITLHITCFTGNNAFRHVHCFVRHAF